jgi:hypothetical protein
MPTDTTQSYTLAAVLKWEEDNLHSRDQITVLAAQSLSPGSVLGKITAGTVPTTGTAGGGNTGNGTMTLVTGGRNVKVGTYTMTCVGLDTNAGVFAVEDPDGEALAPAAVGVAYTSGQINFTINDGATDFALGDTFTVAVPAGGGQYRAINPSGVDGSGVAAGLSYATYDASASGDRTVSYTSGGTYEILPGDTITGATSTSTARVVSLTLSSGTWAGGDAAGVLTLDTRNGALQAENLNVGGNSNVATIGGDSSAVAATDIKGVAITRDAEIVSSELTWPSGTTAAQKATALAELASLGIVVRVEA